MKTSSRPPITSSSPLIMIPSSVAMSHPQSHPNSPQRNVLAWLSNLSIRDRTLLIPVLIFLSSLGILGIGQTALNRSLREQLKSQTQSQLAVTQINYQKDIEVMKASFMSLSENPLIIEKVTNYVNGQALSAEEVQQLKVMLQSMGNLDYAVLVGKNKQVLAEAHNRLQIGSQFDPNGLVSQTLQVKTQKESSETLKKQDKNTLIRYTATPIKRPRTQTVIGVLVSGKIVDSSIVRNTLNTFGNQGYAGIYLYQEKGENPLVTSVNIDQTRKEQQDLPLEDTNILKEAIKARGNTVFDRQTLDNRTYTLASKSFTNYQGEPVGIFVYGDPEIALNKIIEDSLKWPLILSLAGLATVGGLSAIIGYSIANPLKRLQKVTQAFAQGNYNVRSPIHSHDEIGELSHYFNKMADNIAKNDRLIRQETEMFRFLSQTTSPENLKPETLNELFERSVQESRRLLDIENVSIIEATGRIIASDSSNQNLNNLQKALETDLILQLPIINQGELFGYLIAEQGENNREWQETDVSFLGQLVIQLEITLDRLSLRRQRNLDARLSLMLKEITLKIAKAFSVETLFDVVVENTRLALDCDRIIVYAFDETWQGTIVAEGLNSVFPPALGAQIKDPCFAKQYVDQYRQGRVKALNDISIAGLTDCHLNQLAPFAVKANLVAPILVAGELFGLLIAHHCKAPHAWQQPEIDFFTQVALQVGVALERANLLDQQTSAEEEQRKAKELLQRRALDLLMEVDPVNKGDLTVCAHVTEDEIGTIADSYNATIENLRRLVVSVQSAAEQLSETTQSNEMTVQILSEDALQQVKQISGSLEQVNYLMESIQGVTLNAQQALQVVQASTQTIMTGEAAMTETVSGMLTIRNTVTETMKKIKHLGESSQKISKVVNLIGRFAAQTHLLALKASIEAARAGEDGRGFAVIANEVRTLASQSAQATAEIESLVTSIQAETKEVAATMASGTNQVIMGGQLVEKTRHNLQEIVMASSQIQDLVKAITVATTEQSQASESVTQVMTEVVQSAAKSAQSATSVVQSFDKLLMLSKKLQQNVGQFKVQ